MKKGRLFLRRPCTPYYVLVCSWLCAGFLGGLGFVVDGGADLADNFWGHVVHVVGCFGVFVGFLEDFVFGVAAELDVASGDYIAAFQDFGHEESPCFGWEGNRRAAVGGCQREMMERRGGERITQRRGGRGVSQRNYNGHDVRTEPASESGRYNGDAKKRVPRLRLPAVGRL